MLQAEIAGGKVNPKGEPPRNGYRLRDFALKSREGAETRLSDYRGHYNLILVFNEQPEDVHCLLRECACRYQSIREQGAELLLIVPEIALRQNESLQLPFPVLEDPDQQTASAYGLQKNTRPISGIFVADRFGELFASYLGSEIANATYSSILKWLEFINSQCPECEPPEWPLED